MTQILRDILGKKYLAVEFVPLLQFSHISKVSCYCKRIQIIQGFIIQFTQFRISKQNKFLFHPIQMTLNRGTTNRWIATFLSRCIAYYTIKISEACCCKFGISSRILIRHKQEQTKCLVIVMHLSLHHIMQDDAVVGVSIWSDRVLFQSVPTEDNPFKHTTHERHTDA